MALLGTLLKGAPSSTDLNRELLTAGVPNELARLLLHVLGRARGLVHRLANFFTLAVANLLCWLVTLPHCLVEGLLLEGDGAGLLEVLLTHLLLGRSKLGDIRIVALLGVLVGALQDRLLLQAGHLGQLLDAAEPGLPILNTVAEVDAGTSGSLLLSSSSSQRGSRASEEVA